MASVVAVVTTQCFLRKSAEIATPDEVSLATNAANLAGSAIGWAVPLPLRTTRGGGVVTATTNTVLGPTSGIETNDGTNAMQWISPPIDAAVTISGTVTFNLWMGESATTANVGAQCVVERIDNTGAIASTVTNSEKAIELPKTSAIAAQNWTATPTSTAFSKGDRIRIRVAGNDGGGTMASGATFALDYAGTGAAADGDSYVTFNETFGFLTTDPSTQNLYLSDAVETSAATKRQLWQDRGSGVTTAVRNTVAGWAAPTAWTITGGGAAVQWRTPTLTAATLVSPVLVNVRALVSSAAANTSIRAQLWRVTTAGGQVLIGGTTHPTALTITEAVYAFYVAGTDTALLDGERLDLYFYVDDSSAAASASGQTATIEFAGAAGATGDSFVTLGQTLLSWPGPYPFLNMAPRLPG